MPAKRRLAAAKKQPTRKPAAALIPKQNSRAKAVQHADYLSLLHRTKNKKKRNQLIEIASRDQIDAISEVIENILRGTLVLTQVQKEKLRRYKNCMRLLISKSIPLVKKRNQLHSYSGGFLPALLGAAIPAIGSLISGLVGRRS